MGGSVYDMLDLVSLPDDVLVRMVLIVIENTTVVAVGQGKLQVWEQFLQKTDNQIRKEPSRSLFTFSFIPETRSVWSLGLETMSRQNLATEYRTSRALSRKSAIRFSQLTHLDHWVKVHLQETFSRLLPVTPSGLLLARAFCI